MALTAQSASASQPPERVTFWFGCNMLRHGDLIRTAMLLLEKVGYDVAAAGGPGYCCGTAHDGQPHAASNMAARTVARFNAAADSDGRGTVVSWCPSCHMHMHDIMAPGNPTRFDFNHVTALVAARIDRLAPLLVERVERRVLLHRHAGFATHAAVNGHVGAILARIPGLELVDGPAHPGHMCSSLAAVTGALGGAIDATWQAAVAAKADTVATIFHSCHREIVALDGRDGIGVANWVHLVARAMRLEPDDIYRGWRNGAAPAPAAIEKVGGDLYQRLIEPELRKPPPVPAKA